MFYNPAARDRPGGYGSLLFAPGSALRPSIAFAGDRNTGIFQPAGSNSDTWGIATGGRERLRVDASGRVNIGNVGGQIAAAYGQAPQFQINNNVGAQNFSMGRYTADTNSPYMSFVKSRGTIVGTGGSLLSGDGLLDIEGWGFDATGTPVLQQAVTIAAVVDVAPTAGSVPGRLSFSTSASGSASVTERLRIDSNGNVQVTGGTLGYGTGVGGTVTQTTSRATGVTINKICGAITMFSAAGSGTAASFTVTNSFVAATDTIILTQKSGTNQYEFLATTVSAGSFVITFRTTGGTSTDAPVITFAVIKAVTA